METAMGGFVSVKELPGGGVASLVLPTDTTGSDGVCGVDVSGVSASDGELFRGRFLAWEVGSTGEEGAVLSVERALLPGVWPAGDCGESRWVSDDDRNVLTIPSSTTSAMAMPPPMASFGMKPSLSR